MPKGVYVREPRTPKSYPSEVVKIVTKLYREGCTQAEIASTVGLTQKIVWRLMKLHGLPTRRAAKRDQWGQRNHLWKGSAASYKAFHQRLDKRYGQPSSCAHCGATDPTKTYDWANVSGRYDDLDDYLRLCRSCHRTFDNGGASQEHYL